MTSTPPRNLNRRALFGGAAALGLAAVGGTSWALDRFVIEHAEVTGASGYAGLTGTQSSATATASDPTGEGVVDGLIYTSADRTMPWLRLHGLPKPRALMATNLHCARPTSVVEMR